MVRGRSNDNADPAVDNARRVMEPSKALTEALKFIILVNIEFRGKAVEVMGEHIEAVRGFGKPGEAKGIATEAQT